MAALGVERVVYGWTLDDITQQKTLYGFFAAAGKHLYIGKAIRAQKKTGFCLMNQPVGNPFFTKIASVIGMARIFPSHCGLHCSTSFYWSPAVQPSWRVIFHCGKYILPICPPKI
jgi:hypothetical protein